MSEVYFVLLVLLILVFIVANMSTDDENKQDDHPVGQLNRDIAKLDNEIAVLKFIIDNRNKDKMTDKVNELFNQLQEQKSELLALTKKYLDVNANYNKLLVQLQDQVRMASAIKHENTMLKQDAQIPHYMTYNKMVNELADAKRTIKQLSDDLNYLEDCKTNLITSNNEKRHNLRIAQTDIHILKCKIDTLQKQIDADKCTIDALIEQRNALSERNNKWHDSVCVTREKVLEQDERVLLACKFISKQDSYTTEYQLRTGHYDKVRGFVVDCHDEYEAFWQCLVLEWRELPSWK